jgi:hypothetical protein
MYDIAALPHLYGADIGANAGDTVHPWNPFNGVMRTGSSRTIPAATASFLRSGTATTRTTFTALILNADNVADADVGFRVRIDDGDVLDLSHTDADFIA